jgi:hypothetical protein
MEPAHYHIVTEIHRGPAVLDFPGRMGSPEMSRNHRFVPPESYSEFTHCW